jgi:hypothetical protein
MSIAFHIMYQFSLNASQFHGKKKTDITLLTSMTWKQFMKFSAFDDIYVHFYEFYFHVIVFIFQVHRAMLHNGERVAVKVQRPGLKKLFDIDLSKNYCLRGTEQTKV